MCTRQAGRNSGLRRLLRHLLSGGRFVAALLGTGLWNATLLLSEKGYYAMSFVLALYSAVTVQKNVRDKKAIAAGDDGDTLQ